MKCPYCNSENFGKINPTYGDKFALLEIDSKTKQLTSNKNVLLIDIYGCANCKRIVLQSDIRNDEK